MKIVEMADIFLNTANFASHALTFSLVPPKGGFFQKVWFVFLNLQISKKPILSSKFKFQVQDSFLEYIFLEIWRFEKHIALSEKSYL